MAFHFERQRVTLFLRISLAYLILWMIIDLAKQTDQFLQVLVNNLWRVVFIAGVNYLLYEIIIARLTWKKILRSLALLISPMLLLTIGFCGWRYFGFLLSLFTPQTSANAMTVEDFSYNAPFTFFSVVFFGVIRHYVDYNQLKLDAQQLRLEKQTAELNYLKSQTNPHFLFNTLNNIYGLSRDKSDLAPESILRLSKILRFMLYETSGPFIPLEQEVKIISDYLELEKLRYDASLQLSFSHDVEDMKQALPPLLLTPLVENAFKHGVSETRTMPFIDIHLSVKNRQLRMEVKNSTDAPQVEKPIVEKIGLSNLRRQLELLYRDYKLTVTREDGVFRAELRINLASHV